MSRSHRVRPARLAAPAPPALRRPTPRRRLLDDVFAPLICPHCALPLHTRGSTLACGRRHAFDIARDGYVNLLGRPRGGDTRPMLVARRAFLERGHCAPLAAHLTDRVRAAFAAAGSRSTDASPLRLLDAGCGEGYYLRCIHTALSARHSFPHHRWLATDVSKVAVSMAARQAPWAGCFVADIWQRLYVPASSIHVLLNVFAPRNVDEFARIVVPGGQVICVVPMPQHLEELRRHVSWLTIEPHKQERVCAQFARSFTLVETDSVEYGVRMSQADMVDLITMTPNHWHRDEGMERSAQLPTVLTVSAAFRVLVFQRHAALA